MKRIEIFSVAPGLPISKILLVNFFSSLTESFLKPSWSLLTDIIIGPNTVAAAAPIDVAMEIPRTPRSTTDVRIKSNAMLITPIITKVSVVAIAFPSNRRKLKER